MFLAIAIALVIASLIFHESGHWFEMRRRGIDVAQAGIGIPVKFLHVRFSWKRFSGTTFTLSPFILGAYVMPSPDGAKKLEALPYKENAAVYGAGPLANLIFTLFLALVLAFVSGIDWTSAHNVLLVSAWITLPFVLFFGRKFLSAYIVPVVGMTLLVYVGHLLFLRFHGAPGGGNGLTGPVGLVRIMASIARDLPSAIRVAAVVSFNIGIFNMIPLSFLDGGKIVECLMKKIGPRARSLYRASGFMLFLFLMVSVVVHDCGVR